MATSQMAEAETAQGLRLHRAGRIDQAARHYEAALKRDPDDPEANCLLGMIRHQQGRPAQAVELIGRAIALRPDVPGYHASLGLAWQALGGLPEAAEAFAALLALCPDDAAAHVNRGVVVRTLGDRDAALGHFLLAVELDGSLAEARTNLGALLVELGRPAEALPHARVAVALRPDLVEARVTLGDAYRAMGCWLDARAAYGLALGLDSHRAQAAAGLGLSAIQLDLWDEGLAWLRRAVELEPRSVDYLRYLGEAAAARGLHAELGACCQRILDLAPDDAAAHNAMGWFCHFDGRHGEALRCYLSAIRLRPDLAMAHFNLGLLHEEMGETADAEVRFRTAVRLDPSHATALARLASLLRGDLPDDELDALERMLRDSHLSPGDRVKLLFALGEVLDARGEFPAAASRMAQANAMALEQLAQQGRAYDPAEHRRFVDDLLAGFSPELLNRLAGAGLDTLRPVFIIGLPRSGTTLIEQVLASHPEVYGAGEISLARQSLEEIPELLPSPATLARNIAALSPPIVAELAGRHVRRLWELDGGKAARAINKMPENYFYLGLIALMFPRAVVIHCRRDLRDVALSCWNANFVEVRWAHDFDHIATRFAEYRRLMEHWRTTLSPSLAIHEVAYEDAVEDLEGVARRLVAAMGLDWNPACLEFHRTRRPVQTASQNQVRKPIYRTSVGRWKHYRDELAGLFARVEGQEGILGDPPAAR